MTSSQTTCRDCGKAVSQELLGLCPQCMLRAGLGTVDGETNKGPGGTGGWEPPSVEEVSRYFPQLEILELIGRGGMGAVYKARQKQLDRVVAVKILPPGPPDGGPPDPGFAERFAREAKALAQLSHPNIVTLYEFGRADGLFYFLMEYVDGVNLRQLMDGGRSGGAGGLGAKEALAIVPQICEALQFAHDRGIVHRDIKPENILLNREGQVKIADFGVAKIVGGGRVQGSGFRVQEEGVGGEAGAAAGGVTVGRGVVGTPKYMAPEQVERPGEVDHRADIYALGVVFYQMLTGELPGRPIEPPSRKVQIDVRLDEVVLRAMEREPERRYSQARVMKTEVETIAGGGEEMGRQAGGPVLDYALPPRMSRLAVIGACWAGLCVLAIVWLNYLTGERVTPWGQMSSPERLGFLLTEVVCTAGFLGVVGTTVLGWIAVVRIRRSVGRLYGLELAVFDGLVFPLLALCGLIARFWQSVLDRALGEHRAVASGVEIHGSPVGLIVIATVLSSAVAVWVIVRAVWRAVKKGPGDASTTRAVERPRSARPAWAMAVLAGVLLLVMGIFFYKNTQTRQVQARVGELPRRVEQRLHEMDFAWDSYTIEVVPNTPMFLWHFAGLKERTSGGGQRDWRPIQGRLVMEALPDGQFKVRGDGPGRFGQVNFIIPADSVRSQYPKAAHIGRNKATAYIVHDNVDLHYAIFYLGDFGSSSRGSHNTHSLTWIDDGSLKLKSGRTFGFLRESVDPVHLKVNGQEFDLRQGRVLELHDDGTVEQVKLFPSLAEANDVEGLAKRIAMAKAETRPVGDEEAKLRLKQAEARMERIKAQFDAGAAGFQEYQDAKFDRDIAAANLRGDVAGVRRLELEKAEARLERIKEAYEKGAVTMTEYEDAKDAVELARVRAGATTQAVPTTQAAAGTQPAMELKVKKRASEFVDMLATRQFERAVAAFDETMRAAMPAKKLTEVWGELEKAGGKFLGAAAPTRVEQIAECEAVYVPCRWEHNRLDVKVVFDAQGQVTGLWTVAPGGK